MLVTAERARGKRGIGRGKEGGRSTVDPPQVHIDNAPGYFVGNIISVDDDDCRTGKKGNEIFLFPILRLNGPRQQITLVSSGFKLVSLNTYFEL